MLSSVKKFLRLRGRLANWWMRPLERLGVARGPITYRFRNGLQFTFKAMPVRTSLAIVEEVIYDTPYSNSALALSSGDVVVDIGANCGAFSILQNHLISGLTIHAYEPDPENYSFLIKNIQDNDTSAFAVTPPVPHPQSLVAHQCAVVGDNHTSDFVSLYHNPEQMGSHSTESHMDWQGEIHTVKVKAIRFSTILQEHQQKGIALLKIDCEGAEHDMFAHTDPLLFSHVHFIALEYHEVEGHDIPSLRKRLTDLGFRVDDTATQGIWHCWNTRLLHKATRE